MLKVTIKILSSIRSLTQYGHKEVIFELKPSMNINISKDELLRYDRLLQMQPVSPYNNQQDHFGSYRYNLLKVLAPKLTREEQTFLIYGKTTTLNIALALSNIDKSPCIRFELESLDNV